MVPKRSQPSGSGQLGSAARRRNRSTASSNVTPPPRLASELMRAVETDVPSDAPATTAENATPHPLSAADVAESLEHERVELMQIQAMLKCLYEVLLYADDDDSVMHADVANVCARLINESVARLDKLLMHGGEHSGDNLGDSEVSEPCGSEK